jgi:hypothetical protein
MVSRVDVLRLFLVALNEFLSAKLGGFSSQEESIQLRDYLKYEIIMISKY